MRRVVQRSLRKRRSGGFTLLEVMIAVSILALSIMWMVEATTHAIEAENHAKLMTTAVFLARAQLVELEDKIREKSAQGGTGLSDDAFASEESGDFEEDGFKRFKWHRIVEKVELPGTDVLQTAMSQLTGGSGGASGSSSSSSKPSIPGVPGGAQGSAGMMASQFDMVKKTLEDGIRKAKVKITWTENGQEKFVEVQEFITDYKAVDKAFPGPTVKGHP